MKTFILGLDIGSRNIKIAVMETASKLAVHLTFAETSTDIDILIQSLINTALSTLGIAQEQIAMTVVTGYGRHQYSANAKVSTEINCHALGLRCFNHEIRTIIDIGGQDFKLILLSKEGKVRDFSMNDKCAAGTGRFLEVAAKLLSVSVDAMGELASRHDKQLSLTSTCVVFAESEIIGLRAQGEKRENIAFAVHQSIAHRVLSQLQQMDFEFPLAFTGGVALDTNLASIIESTLSSNIYIADHPMFTGAIGACCLGLKELR